MGPQKTGCARLDHPGLDLGLGQESIDDDLPKGVGTPEGEDEVGGSRPRTGGRERQVLWHRGIQNDDYGCPDGIAMAGSTWERTDAIDRA